MKKLGLLILAALMLAGVVACDRGANRAGGQGRSAQARWPGPEPRDLGGMVFKIVDWSPVRFFPANAEIGTPIGDAKLAAMESIMEDFNITFEIIQISSPDTFDRVYPAVLAGDMFAHMIITTQSRFGLFIGAGILADLSTIPTLNLNSGLWAQPVHEITGVGGQVLATAGIFDHWDFIWGLFFQKTLWAELGLPDPYEMVRRGEWTWDRFLEFAVIAAEDLDGDGVINNPNDRWGLVVNADDFLRSWWVSMGSKYWDFNPAGRLYTPVATPDGIAIARWMRNFTEMPGVYYRATGQFTNTRNEMFMGRRALFFVETSRVLADIRAMEDDWGMLPWPKRNEQQPMYLNTVNHNAPLIGVTIANDQLEETGIIMEAMAARFELVRELQWAELEDRVLRSDEDIEMMREFINPNRAYDIGHIMWWGRHGFDIPHTRIAEYVIFHTLNDFASAMEASRHAIELTTNEFYFGN